MVTIHEAIARVTTELNEAGIDSAGLDARLLLMAVTEFSREDLLLKFDQVLPDVQRLKFTALVDRRKSREPVSRILGQREFWSLPFKINDQTLDPRPDSECLVEACLDLRQDLPDAPSILDLGTGSGCLLLALLSEWPKANGVGVDRSEGAVSVAIENSQALVLNDRASFIVGDWCQGVDQKFDLIISNPPYIAGSEMAALEPEVTNFDPLSALVASEDGYSDFRKIIEQVSSVLNDGGYLVFEHGYEQQTALETMLAASGWRVVDKRHDLAGVPRVIIAQL